MINKVWWLDAVAVRLGHQVQSNSLMEAKEWKHVKEIQERTQRSKRGKLGMINKEVQYSQLPITGVCLLSERHFEPHNRGKPKHVGLFGLALTVWC